MNPDSPDPLGFNRRDFLKSGSCAVLTMMGGVPLMAETKPAQPTAEELLPKVTVAVIGLGSWGRQILTTLGQMKEAVIAGLCDTYSPYLKRSAKEAPGAAQTDDYKTILGNKDIETVVIATPTHKHKEIVLAALKAGKHVYCEAPIAHTIEEAREIATAARAAKKLVFQAGLQLRSDEERVFLMPFIRSGDLGKNVMARAQWHKKQSWVATASNPEQEKALNWRLDKSISLGLIGEIGIHQVDQARWFLNAPPLAVTGYGRVSREDATSPDVPDTIHAIFEFPKKLVMAYDCSLASSFDTEYELYYGGHATVMLRNGKAWMFKEVDSPMEGWEIYAKKDKFFKETGIALIVGGSKQTNMAAQEPTAPPAKSSLQCALENFLRNSHEIGTAAADYVATYGADDADGLNENLALKRKEMEKHRPFAGYAEGFETVVTSVKANEAILTGQRVVLKPEWYELG